MFATAVQPSAAPIVAPAFANVGSGQSLFVHAQEARSRVAARRPVGETPRFDREPAMVWVLVASCVGSMPPGSRKVALLPPQRTKSPNQAFRIAPVDPPL